MTARPNRKAATVNEEAYPWAKRINIEAVDTAVIPMGMANKGRIRGVAERSSMMSRDSETLTIN